MSSLRNAVKRREHKERGQLQERKKLGLLEKHKDYVLRAKDYNKKQKRLRAMQVKASFRNPDEFYFRMNSSQTKEGIHISENNHGEKLSNEYLKNLKNQDLAYLQMKYQMDCQKIDKLKKGLHFIQANIIKKNQHQIFVDTQKEIDEFNPVEHFDTVPELIERSYNRLRKESLQKNPLLLVKKEENTKKSLKRLGKEQDAKYRELNDRIQRANKLKRMAAHLELDRKLQAKGKKRKIKEASNGQPAVYKWKQQRQK
jgi:U3 small nucleolar RNA-associated protein 11